MFILLKNKIYLLLIKKYEKKTCEKAVGLTVADVFNNIFYGFTISGVVFHIFFYFF